MITQIFENAETKLELAFLILYMNFRKNQEVILQRSED